VTDAIIRQALPSPMKDFEDAVTSAVAESEKLEIIITRNLRDFAIILLVVHRLVQKTRATKPETTGY